MTCLSQEERTKVKMMSLYYEERKIEGGATMIYQEGCKEIHHFLIRLLEIDQIARYCLREKIEQLQRIDEFESGCG